MKNNKTKLKILLSASLFSISILNPHYVNAAVNEISPNTIEGVSITVNGDNSSNNEPFTVFVGGTSSQFITFQASNEAGALQTLVQNQDDVVINYDANNGGAGTFAIQSGGTNVFTMNNAGNATFTENLTVQGSLTVQEFSSLRGINNNNEGIINTGSIAGATTIDANGNITTSADLVTTGTGDLSVADDGSIGGDLTVTGNYSSTNGNITLNNGNVNTQTLSVDGTSTLNGIGNTGALTSAGGAVSLNASSNNNTNINTGTSTGTVAIGNSASTTNILGATNINTSGAATTSIGTGGTGVVNIGNATGGTSVTGTLGVSGATTLSSTLDVTGNYTSTNGNITLTNGNVNTQTLSVDSNATVGGTLGVTGATTLSGGATVNNGFTAYSANSTGNSINVGATQTTNVGINTVTYGTSVTGGMLVTGDLGVNGNIYSLNPTANANVNVANNGLTITGATNAVGLISDNNSNISDGRAQVSLTPTTAAVTVTNSIGNAHGLNVGTTNTVLSGGINSTTMTLDDSGATFAQVGTGNPVTVRGIADGVAPFDAVNVRQMERGLNEVRSGVASAAAMANIPDVEAGKKYSFGVGTGAFADQTAFAMGGGIRITDSVALKGSYGTSSDGNNTFAVGAGFSW